MARCLHALAWSFYLHTCYSIRFPNTYLSLSVWHSSLTLFVFSIGQERQYDHISIQTMKKLFLLIIVLVGTLTSFAQDIIVTTDAKKIEAKILEVSKQEIRYKEIDNLEGPTFVLSTDEISSIIYSNGKVTLYNNSAEPETDKSAPPVTIPPATNTAPQSNDNLATIKLLSGDVITAQIKDINRNGVTYLQNNISYTLSASQIENVTFANGQVKTYNTPVTSVSQPSIITTESSGRGRIYRDGREYMYNDTYISSKEVERILRNQDALAYEQWKRGRRLSIGGAVVTGVGAGLALGSLAFTPVDLGVALGLSGAGLVVTGVGVILICCAPAKYNKAIDIYNSKYDNTAMQLNFFVAPSEVGIALNF